MGEKGKRDLRQAEKPLVKSFGGKPISCLNIIGAHALRYKRVINYSLTKRK